MSTFDVRHPHGDLLVHLQDESFNPKLRDLLDTLVPSLPHGEITQSRIERLRERSVNHPKLHIPHHDFGPICLEVLQPSCPVDDQTWEVVMKITGALVAEQK